MTAPSVEIRRKKVAEILLARPRISVRDLADELTRAGFPCRKSTAAQDKLAVLAEWRARRQEMIDQYAAEDLARSDAAIEALWPHVLASKGWAIGRLLGLLSYRADVLGTKVIKQETDIGEALARVLEGLSCSSGSAND